MPDVGREAPRTQDSSPLMPRRTFLITAGGAGAALVGGLATHELLRDKRTPDQRETDEGITKLHEYVGELEDSQIKRDLEIYVLPIFSNPKPEFIETSEGRIPVKSRTITYDLVQGNPSDPAQYNGSLNVISDVSGEILRIPDNRRIRFPLPYLLKEGEISSHPELNPSEDGSVTLDIDLSENYATDYSISPQIDIKLLDPKTHNADAETFRNVEKLIFIKEALGLLYYLKYYERVVAQMREQGIDRTLEVVDSRGEEREVDTATVILGGVNKNGGRYLAVQDLAAYYLMFTALNDTATESLLRRDPNFADALDHIDHFKENEASGDIYEDAARWAITSPVVERLAHTGDLNKIP